MTNDVFISSAKVGIISISYSLLAKKLSYQVEELILNCFTWTAISAVTSSSYVSPDGKMRLTDVLDGGGVTLLAKAFPNTRASKFLDWFTYSESGLPVFKGSQLPIS